MTAIRQGYGLQLDIFGQIWIWTRMMKGCALHEFQFSYKQKMRVICVCVDFCDRFCFHRLSLLSHKGNSGMRVPRLALTPFALFPLFSAHSWFFRIFQPEEAGHAAFSAVDFKLSAQNSPKKNERKKKENPSYEKCIINELDCRIGGKGGGDGRGTVSSNTP